MSPISKTFFTPADETHESAVSIKDIEPFLISKDFIRLVFVNGVFSRDLSDISKAPDGVTVKNLKEALAEQVVEQNLAKHAKIEENGFVALNTAFLQEGMYIHVAKNVIAERPIHALFVSNSKANELAVQPRNLVVADENTQVQFIESYVALTDATYFTNPVSEIVAAENAVVAHYKIQRENTQAFHTGLTQIQQKRNSNYTSHNYAFGGAIARNDINVILDGEGGECTLNGLYLTSGKQLIDNHSIIEHVQPYCISREIYKGILGEVSRAVFSGKIHVHPDAQKTDAIQSNQNLLLSDDATVDTKPQLEIYADDVKCTHGGTVGQIDQDSIFYLRARGISEETAKSIMIQAFAGEVTDKIKNEAIRKYVEQLVSARLKA